MSMVNAFSNLEISAIIDGVSEIVVTEAAQGLILALESKKHSLLVVTASSRRADELTDELRTYLGTQAVVEFPPWETLPHEKLSPKSDTIAARFRTLRQINGLEKTPPPRVVVTSIRALLQPIIADLLGEELITLEIEQEITMGELIAKLHYFGYLRTDLVERRGDFAVRGGILDLFPPDREHPIRVEFFGDEIEELRFFTVADQLSQCDLLFNFKGDQFFAKQISDNWL